MAKLSVPVVDDAQGELVPQITENPFTVDVPQISEVPQIIELPVTLVPQIREAP